LAKVAPAVDRAQKAVQDDLLPRLLDLLNKMAATPAGGEAREILTRLDQRAGASMEVMKAEYAKSQKSSKAKKIFTIAAVGAVVGALAVAIKTFLGSREDWAAYEPDEPYVFDDNLEMDEAMVEGPDTPVEENLEDIVDSSEDTLDPFDVMDVAQGGLVAETAEVAEADDDSIEISESKPYGEGSYAGPNPPEGFDIKGNERSMKYHMKDASGYDRTSADVWFETEEAAQAAGFARSKR